MKLLIVGVVVLLLLLSPLAIIWALNTIAAGAGWGWQIPYTWHTWTAVLILGGLSAGSNSK